MFYRNSRQSGYTRLDLSSLNETERTWSGVIPADQVVPGYLEYYFGANSVRWGAYDESIAHRPPYHVLVNNNDSRPVISYTPPSAPVKGNSANLTVKASANAKLKSVSVYYKLMPAYYEWLPIEMQPNGDGSYTASVPLTPEGILYYFEAVDEDGNGANYPNVLEQTPYMVVDSWDPQVASR